MKKCMNCGAELPEEASFCPYCTATQNEKHQVVPRWPRRRRLWMAGGAAVLAVILFFGLWLLRDSGREAGLPAGDEQTQQPAAAAESLHSLQPSQKAVPSPEVRTSQPVEPSPSPRPSQQASARENTDDIGFPLDTPVDIRAELQPSANAAGFQEVLLHLNPGEDGIYIFNIAGTPLADAYPAPGGIDLLDHPMAEASGMYGDTWGMHDYMFARCFKLEADQTYDFCVRVPAAGLDLTQPVTAAITMDWDFADDVIYDINLAANDSVHGSVNIMLGAFLAMADSLELDESYDPAVVSVMWNPQQKNDLLITGLSGGTTAIDVKATFMGETKTVTFTVSVFNSAGGPRA